VRGKVGYMSPEMARNQPIDARSDLFSLGVSIYETLIGERIYTGDLNTPPDKIYAQTVPPLAAKCTGLPDGLQPVLNRALAINPDQRYPDAESFAQALRQVAQESGLLYSAIDLAAELRDIMGPNADYWLTDQRDPTHLRSQRAHTEDMDSLVEPGSSITAGEDSGIEDVDTPPFQASASPPVGTGQSSGQLPAAGRSTGKLPVTGIPSDPAMQATPPPSLPLPPVKPAEPPPVARPMPPFASQRSRLAKAGGGIAAIPRSRRGLWLALLILLAVAIGFAFVRFVLSPSMVPSSLHGPVPTFACSRCPVEVSPWTG
jgi:serine/threonine protein kinase